MTKRNNLFPYRKLFIIAHCNYIAFQETKLERHFFGERNGEKDHQETGTAFQNWIVGRHDLAIGESGLVSQTDSARR